MPAVTSAEEISEIAFGFMASKALFAALHVDLFTQLGDGARSTAELAAACGVHPDRLTTLLTVLGTLGLVERDGDRHRNAPGSEAFLVRGAKHDFGDYLRFQIDRQMYPFMEQLDAVLEDRIEPGMIDSYARWMSDPEAARLYSESQHSGSLGPARSLVRRIDLGDARRVLDVGGGTGAFAITLAQAWPELEVTVIDFPNVAELGADYAAEAGVGDRVHFVGGDALSTDWPREVDAVLMSYLYSGVPGEAIEGLIARSFEHLRSGGRYLVHDFMVDDDRSGPKLAALWQLQHTAFNPHARSVTPGWVAGLMDAAGFRDIESEAMIPGMTMLVQGRRP